MEIFTNIVGPVGQIFNTIFFYPTVNLLLLFYKAFISIGLPGAFGFAIVGLTLTVRLILHPFFKQQMDTTKKMQDIKPHMDALSVKHKDDKKKLQEEQMKLYQQAGINPAAGCIFMIVQIPVFIALYNSLNLFLTANTKAGLLAINKIAYSPMLYVSSIDPYFLGFNLTMSPQKSGMWFYYIIPIVTAILQYFQVQTTMPSQPKKDKNDKKDEKKNDAGDFQSAMNTQMKFIFPLMIGWFSYTLPVGLSLYWNIFSIFSIMQSRLMKKPVTNLAKTNEPKK